MGRITKYLFQFYRGTFFKTEVNADTESGYNEPAKYRFKEVEPHLFKREPIFVQKNRSERFCNRYRQGHRCYGFFNGRDSLVSYLWVSISDREITIPWALNMELILRPGNAYIWDCFTAEDHRREGLYKKGLLKAKSISFRKGAKRIYIFCADENIYSRAGIVSAGFKEIFSFSGVGLGPLRFIKKSGRKTKTAIRGQAYDIITA